MAASAMEYQNNKFVLRSTNHAAMIFNGGLITLPPVPLHFEDDVFKTPHRRSSSHHKARHSQGVTPDAQPHRPQTQ